MQVIRLKFKNYSYTKIRTLTPNIILFRKIKEFCIGLTWKWPLPPPSVGGCLWDLCYTIHPCMGHTEILPFSTTAKIIRFTVWAVIAIVLTSLALLVVLKRTKIFPIAFRQYFMWSLSKKASSVAARSCRCLERVPRLTKSFQWLQKYLFLPMLSVFLGMVRIFDL